MCFLDLPKMEIASVMLIDRGYDGQFDLAWTVFVLLGIIIANGPLGINEKASKK